MHIRSFVAAGALLLAALGCRDDAESPTAPATEPVLDLTTAHVLEFREVDAGHFHTCGLAIDRRAYSWGDNFAGRLGDGTESSRPVPVVVVGRLRFRQVSAGGNHSCGVTTDKRAYCWGSNTGGALGDGTTIGGLIPVPVPGDLRFRYVSAGGLHTCGLTTDDRVFCWGDNRLGTLVTAPTQAPRHVFSVPAAPDQ